MDKKIDPKRFFDKEQKALILRAITDAELKTSGEVRVHVASFVKKTAYDDAVAVFNKLRMYRTKDRNGALLFVTLRDRKLAIIGDAGIHAKVGEHFWDEICVSTVKAFSEERFLDGIVAAVARIGEQLKMHFPRSKADINELADDISFDDD